MKTDIWMPIYIGDYFKDTRHLDTEDHGAYLLIMMEMWNRKGKINKSLLSVVALKEEEYFYKKIWPKLKDFFTENNGELKQKRLTKELKASLNRRKVAKDNGKKGGRPKTQEKPIGLEPVNPQETSSSSPSSSPLPKDNKHKKPITSELENSSVWDSSDFWLRDLVKKQTIFNDDQKRLLLDYEWWVALDESMSGISGEDFMKQQFAKMKVWKKDNGNRWPTSRGVRKFVKGWLERAKEKERKQWR